MIQKSVTESKTMQSNSNQKKTVQNNSTEQIKTGSRKTESNPLISAQAGPLSREKCESLEQVRTHIDLIDQHLIELIATRQFYVDQAVPFKRTEQAVQAPERVEAVLAKVREQAQAQGVDPALIEALYKSMIDHFIQRELKEIRP